MRSDPERLADALDALARIDRYARRGEDVFRSDELVQSWIVHHLQILGEALRGISAGFVEAHPELPWRAVVGMRNVLAHGYFDVDLDAVWATVSNDLPPLRAHLQAIPPAADA